MTRPSEKPCLGKPRKILLAGAPVLFELLVGMLNYFTYSYTRYGSDRTSHQAEPTNATKGYSTQSADRQNLSQSILFFYGTEIRPQAQLELLVLRRGDYGIKISLLRPSLKRRQNGGLHAAH